MRWKYIIIITIINLAYIVFGGWIFSLLEEEFEKTGKLELQQYTNDFLANHTCVDKNELELLIRKVVDAYRDGYLDLDPAAGDGTRWDIADAIFFASTITTTIGYGHIAPATWEGQLFCVFYALIGIPLCLTNVAAIGIKLGLLTQYLDKKFNRGYLSERVGQVLRGLTLFIIGLTLFLLVPAAILMTQEDWSYGESGYYAFITLTTIGFGDYVPGQNDSTDYKWWYAISISFWILIGLSWCAACITVLQEIYQSIFYPEDNGNSGDEEKEELGEVIETMEDEQKIQESKAADLNSQLLDQTGADPELPYHTFDTIEESNL